MCEVVVTGPAGEGMHELSRAVVSARLAASANVWTGSVLSTYWWRGTLEVAEETRVHFLTREELVPQLVEFVQQRHPYELPNVSATRLTGGSAPFAAWIRAETTTR